MLITLGRADDFDEWRSRARSLLQDGVPPAAVDWVVLGDGQCDLLSGLMAHPPQTPPQAPDKPARTIVAPQRFIDLAKSACLADDPARHALLYRFLWRLQEDRRIIGDATDADLRQIELLAKAVRRDSHKMRAFLRFRACENDDGEEQYIAWFEPQHFIERANAGFFMRRFATMRWMIMTPRLTLDWDGTTLHEGPPGSREALPPGDMAEDLWHEYFRSIFNPARLKIKAMLKEMPKRYWANMPETALIPQMIAGAQQREIAMLQQGSEAPSPIVASLADLRAATSACTRCPIHACAKQAVHGEGPADAPLMIVGEQPGDMEDLAGRPFIGPAGQLLDQCLSQAGIDRSAAYLTNAVKHFKNEPRGKRRLHQTPTAGEIDHCRWWLDAERDLIRPRIILALGASAARGILGRTSSVTQLRAEPITLNDGTRLFTTVHPSFLLRCDPARQADERAMMIADLKRCQAALDAIATPSSSRESPAAAA